MKLNRLINNANFILNANDPKNIYLPRNPSFISSNNENNKSNLSITTNASLAKINSSRIYNINQTPKKLNPINIKFNFDRNLSRCGSLPILSPISTKMKRHQLEILEKADYIVKDRLKKGEGISINGRKKYLRKSALKLSKDISLHNYMINLLKVKRTEINENERIMNNALIEFTNQYHIDYKTFIEYIEKVKRKQQLVENLINKIKSERERKENILNEQMFESKRLEDTLEKKLRQIYNTNILANFIHNIFQIPFNYKILTELNRNIKLEEVSDKIIYIYETKDKNEQLPSILKDEQLLIQKYIQMEDKIIHGMENRDLIIKDIYNCKENYKKELKLLENSYKEYEKDLNYYKEELHILSKSMKNLKVHEDDEINNYIGYIIEIGKEIINKIPKKRQKYNINRYIGYCKNVLKAMEEKEVTINNYINEIELILNYGENDDKILVEKCISEIKKINKKENQLRIKQKQEQLENEKNLRYIRRAQRIVVKGRKVSPIFPKIKHVNKIKKININKDDEIECIYSVTDDEK